MTRGLVGRDCTTVASAAMPFVRTPGGLDKTRPARQPWPHDTYPLPQMSRAFVKEGDGALDPLPDLPLSLQPNLVTPRALAARQARLQALQLRLQVLRARPDRLDRLPEAAAERDIRHAEARLRRAIVIDPDTHDLSQVAFGLAVTVRMPEGSLTSWTITGEDEADAPRHRIAPHSPLARALLGASVGDQVDWPRPSGTLTLTITDIRYDADPPA
jgi:transcription elongation factor GreB